MEPQTAAEYRVSTDIFVKGLPKIETTAGNEDGWFTLDLGRATLYFDNKAHFKAFVGKLMEEAAKL